QAARVAAHVVAQPADRLARLAAQTQAVAQPRRVEPDEQLGAPRALALAAEGDPQRRVVRLGAPAVVLADARPRPPAAPLRLPLPAVPAQHRGDVALRQRPAQLDERIAHREAVTPALPLHPRPAVVLRQLHQEAERVRTEPAELVWGAEAF